MIKWKIQKLKSNKNETNWHNFWSLRNQIIIRNWNQKERDRYVKTCPAVLYNWTLDNPINVAISDVMSERNSALRITKSWWSLEALFPRKNYKRTVSIWCVCHTSSLRQDKVLTCLWSVWNYCQKKYWRSLIHLNQRMYRLRRAN